MVSKTYNCQFVGSYDTQKITASNMNDLRKKAFRLMSKTKKQEMYISQYGEDLIDVGMCSDAFRLMNTVFGDLNKDYGEVYTKNGVMWMVEKSTGRLVRKTSIWK